MPFGRGRNWFGRGFWKWRATGTAVPYWGYGGYGGYGGYWGRGNPYPFCRRFPWMPRGWWAMPTHAPWSGYPAGVGLPYGGYSPAYGQAGFISPTYTPGIWPHVGGLSSPRPAGPEGA